MGLLSNPCWNKVKSSDGSLVRGDVSHKTDQHLEELQIVTSALLDIMEC